MLAIGFALILDFLLLPALLLLGKRKPEASKAPAMPYCQHGSHRRQQYETQNHDHKPYRQQSLPSIAKQSARARWRQNPILKRRPLY